MQHTAWNPANQPGTVQQLVEGQADFIAVTTPDTAGTELAVKHGLGYIPKGVEIWKQPYVENPAIGDGLSLVGESGTEWTKQVIFLKFSRTGVNMTLAVF